MLEDIIDLLGLSDYPFIAVIITGIVFVFMIHCFFSIVNAILKRVGGYK